MAPSHYQLSFTARQAMAFFAVCLVALGLSFFFGLMAGLSGRPAAVAQAPAPVASAPAASAPAEGDGSVSAPLSPGVSAPMESPTPPAVIQTFEDRVSEPTAVPTVAAKRPVRADTPAAAPSGLWIQVASLASRREADTLAARLTGHGFHAQVLAADSTKGKVFRVRVGPYRSEDEAARASEKLRRQERIPQTWVVRDGR